MSSRRLLQAVQHHAKRSVATATRGVRLIHPMVQQQRPALVVGSAPLTTVRSFAAKRSGGGGGDSKVFSIHFVYASFELDERPDADDLMKFRTVNTSGKRITVANIQRTIAETFGMEQSEVQNLQYYENSTWQPLTDPVKQLGGKQAVPIRSPDSYTEEDEEDEMYGGRGGGGPVSDSDDEDYLRDSEYDRSMYEQERDYLDDELLGGNVSRAIKDLVATLKKDKYVCSSKSFEVKDPQGNVLPTRDYVLHASVDDEELQKILVNNIGAMEHIVNSIHYPFLWKDDPEEEKSSGNSSSPQQIESK